MKKIFFFLLVAAVSGVAFSSCQKTPAVPDSLVGQIYAAELDEVSKIFGNKEMSLNFYSDSLYEFIEVRLDGSTDRDTMAYIYKKPTLYMFDYNDEIVGTGAVDASGAYVTLGGYPLIIRFNRK